MLGCVGRRGDEPEIPLRDLEEAQIDSEDALLRRALIRATVPAVKQTLAIFAIVAVSMSMTAYSNAQGGEGSEIPTELTPPPPAVMIFERDLDHSLGTVTDKELNAAKAAMRQDENGNY